MILPHETAQMGRDKVEEALEDFRKRIARSGFGVTIQTDHNGAWGRMGKTYVTLRSGDLTYSLELTQLTSYHADHIHNTYLNEDK